MLRTIDIDQLLPGMFVNQVIEQTGRLKIKSKGLVKQHETISALKIKGVIRVQVDDSKSEIISSADEVAVPAKVVKSSTPAKNASLEEQFAGATKLYEKAKDVHRDYLQKMADDQTVELDTLYDLSHQIIDSVFEAPNALSCLSLLQRSDEYLLEHSLNCAILMAMFARHLEYTADEIEELCLAALLMDVGMANVPHDIISKTDPLTKTERDIITSHVDIGLDIAERCGDVSHFVRDIIFNHHERVDGSGYPDAKSAEEISQVARMAAIVDSYDAMITNRKHQVAITPTSALKKLLIDPGYDQQLVQQFIQCMSVHPVGSLVKLTNERLAIVIKANKVKPLHPLVATFYHLKSNHFAETKIVDLSKSNESIETSVRPEEFGVSLPKFFKKIFVGTL
jgi:HD-GYP domain-containing protein (c-di-GMP phosphodiesterase class II)